MVPRNLGQLLFLTALILPLTPMLYDSHISLLTTVSVWWQQLQDVFKSLLLMSCWGWPSVFHISHPSCTRNGLLAPAFTRLLLGVIMCAGSGSPTGVHEFVLYRHWSLSQSRHSEGREPSRDGVDLRGLLFIAVRGVWPAKVESLFLHTAVTLRSIKVIGAALYLNLQCNLFHNIRFIITPFKRTPILNGLCSEK